MGHENMHGKMGYSNAIGNANLELQRQVKNKIERVFLHYLKRFGTAENFFENKDGKWCILTVFETMRNCRDHFDAFACIIVTHSITKFETAMRRNSTWFDLIKGAPAILDPLVHL